MTTVCKLCGKRRARRYCPGVSGDICPVCCGTERENTVDCPQDCEHLQVARVREKPAPLTAANVPNQDVHLTEEFIQQHEELIVWLTMALRQAMEKERAVDLDSKEALDALIRTYRTLESGLIYETRPQNPFAAAIQTAMRESVEELRTHQAQEAGMQTLRDADVLGALVFLQRLELQHDNGRRRGRAFFDFLRSYFPAPPAPASVEL
ncbi:MAG: hypothetical protein ABSB35_09260 [Bryobacteraceae bacterium]